MKDDGCDGCDGGDDNRCINGPIIPNTNSKKSNHAHKRPTTTNYIHLKWLRGQGPIVLILLVAACWSIIQQIDVAKTMTTLMSIDRGREDNASLDLPDWNNNQLEEDLNIPKEKDRKTLSQPFKSPPSSSIVSLSDNSSRNIKQHHNHTEAVVYRHPNFHFDFPLCLVHVGKSSGSSISCGLGFQYADCEGMPRQELPHTYYFHMKKNNCQRPHRPQPPKKDVVAKNKNNKAGMDNNNYDHIATFLFTVRNPLTRIQSWFEFEKNIVPTRRNKRIEQQIRKKRGLLFVECYTTFESFVNDGLQPLLANERVVVKATSVADMTCPERAWAAAMGVRDFSYHEYYNYEHYYTSIVQQQQQQQDYPSMTQWNQSSSSSLPSSISSSSSTMLVLRTEHLAEDWAQLSKEPLFRQVNRRGTRGNVPNFDPNNTNTTINKSSLPSNIAVMTPPSSTTTGIHWPNLCRALCDEIQYYKRILYRSQNIDDEQRRISIEEVRSMCPEETMEIRTCPETTLPTFPLMIVPQRQYQSETKKRLFKTSE